MNEIGHLQSFMGKKDLDNETIHKYIKIYQETNCPDAYDAIINGLVNYMLKMCRNFKQQYTYYTQQELLSCIYNGMERAIDKFEPEKGACFKTYAVWWFKYYVKEYNLRNNSKVNISQATLSKMKRLSGLIEIDSDISNEQLSEAMNTSVKTIIRLKSIKECMNNYSISGDEFINSQMEMKLFEDSQIDYDPELLRECLNELKPRDKIIIIERFGFNDGHPKTLGEIGKQLGLTAERIRQILNNLMPKLKKIYKNRLKI